MRRSKACLYIGELTTGASPRLPTIPRESTEAPLKGSTLPMAKTSPACVRKTATATPSTSAATPPSSGIASTRTHRSSSQRQLDHDGAPTGISAGAIGWICPRSVVNSIVGSGVPGALTKVTKRSSFDGSSSVARHSSS